jgi:hypothetical protein
MSNRNSILISVCLCWVGSFAFADDPAGRGTPSAAGVLLFKSGRALAGQISETDTHYIVSRTSGTMQVLKSDVEFAGADFDSVYLYKRKDVDDRDIDGHISLAQWCMQCNLRTRAAEELSRAAELAAPSSTPQRMVERLQRNLRAAEKTITLSDPVAVEGTPAPRSQESATITEPLANPQDISPALVSNFSVQIQPMLTRACSTAGCHDSGHGGSFVLQRSPRPVAKLTQQNLRSVLAHIETDDPDSSPLVKYAARPHGKSNANPLGKAAGDPAYQTLLDWVRAVSGKATKSLDADVSGANARGEQNTVATGAGGATTAPKQPAQLGQTSIGDRETNEIKAKLEEINGMVRVRSNKPLAATPSRIRAGMIQPAAPPPSAPPAPPPELSSPLQPRNASSPPAQKPGTIVAAASTSESPLRTTTPPTPQPTADAPSTPYQPVDQFDPEIFNRQFAPRSK